MPRLIVAALPVIAGETFVAATRPLIAAKGVPSKIAIGRAFDVAGCP
jgi:hypothetical protein